MNDVFCQIVYARQIRVTHTCYLINKWFSSALDEDKLALFLDAMPEFRYEAPETVDKWIRWGNLFPRTNT